MKIEALTDSYSIFSYLAAAHLKLPAEKSTYYHVAYLREKLVSRHIRSYNWTDTRDMVADGLTKGTADRSPLAAIMDGTYNLHYNVHEYCEPSATGSSAQVHFAPDVYFQEPALQATAETVSPAHDDVVYERASTASVSSQLCDHSGGSAYGASPAEITRRGEYLRASRLNSMD